jgi:hypothetical protein
MLIMFEAGLPIHARTGIYITDNKFERLKSIDRHSQTNGS